MSTTLSRILTIVLVTFPFMVSATGVPLMVPYSGTVQVQGEAFNGAGQFKFAIVNQQCALAQNGCATLWSNDGNSLNGGEPSNAVNVTVNQGHYSLKLGDAALANMTEIPSTVFDNPNTYLRVWFTDGLNGFQLLTPDRQFVAIPYAYRAQGSDKADSVANSAIGAAQIKDDEVQKRVTGTCSGQVVTGINLDGSVICEPDNGEAYTAGTGVTITGGEIGIAAGGVTATELASNSVSTATIANSAVTGAKIADASIDNSKISGVDWTKLSGIPADFADGVDNGVTSFVAPLAINGTTVLLTPCQSGEVYKSIGGGKWSCAADSVGTEVDGVIGNEVVGATNTSLSRSGSGTAASPFTLGLNLANANTWTGTQSFASASVGTLTVGPSNLYAATSSSPTRFARVRAFWNSGTATFSCSFVSGLNGATCTRTAVGTYRIAWTSPNLGYIFSALVSPLGFPITAAPSTFDGVGGAFFTYNTYNAAGSLVDVPLVDIILVGGY